MAGNANSGPRANTLSAIACGQALAALTRPSLEVIKAAVKANDLDTAWRVVEHVKGKPKQSTELSGSLENRTPASEALQAFSTEQLRAFLTLANTFSVEQLTKLLGLAEREDEKVAQKVEGA